MPLVAFALASYVLGLLFGLSGVVVPALLACAGVGAGGLLVRRGAAALALCAAAGVLVGASALASRDRCLAAERTRDRWVVRLDADVAPGGSARGVSLSCGAPVRLLVASGSAAAGSAVVARGSVARSRDADLLIRDAEVRVVGAPPLLDRWRSVAGARVDTLFGEDAPLARALLVADTRQLAPEVRDRFAAAGLAHLLSISGLHVGIIAMALELLAGVLGVPRRWASGGSLALVAIYVAVIGAPPPALRAAAMLGVRAFSRAIQRPTSPWAVLALGSAAPLADPWVAPQAGWQLSVLGVASVACADRLVRRLAPERDDEPGWGRTLLVAFAGSVIATVAAAPLVAWHFGRVSLVAPLADVAAAPLIAIAQPMLFAALSTAWLHPLAALLADASHPLLAAIDWVAASAAALPGAGLEVAPSVPAALLGGGATLAMLVAVASVEWETPAIAALAAVAALVWLPIAPRAVGAVELHMLDVGQGDALALRTPHGHWVLFDAGPSANGRDAGRMVVVPYLAHRGGPLDAFVLSHPHTDHVGGAASVERILGPTLYVDPGFPGGGDAYRASLDEARRDGTRWRRVHPGDTLSVDGVSIALLAPDSAWTASLDDPNLASTIALVQYGMVRFLLVGDAESPEEAWVVARWGDSLHADVLKVGHHGSATSSSDAFLDAVRPRLALVSVGAHNRYGHPSADVLSRLARRRAMVLRTDLLGTVVVRTDGDRLWLEADGETWQADSSRH